MPVSLASISNVNHESSQQRYDDLVHVEGTPSDCGRTKCFKWRGLKNYRLTIRPGEGVGDAMANHNGMTFTTRDRDHDNSGSNCASRYGSA